MLPILPDPSEGLTGWAPHSGLTDRAAAVTRVPLRRQRRGDNVDREPRPVAPAAQHPAHVNVLRPDSDTDVRSCGGNESESESGDCGERDGANSHAIVTSCLFPQVRLVATSTRRRSVSRVPYLNESELRQRATHQTRSKTSKNARAAIERTERDFVNTGVARSV